MYSKSLDGVEMNPWNLDPKIVTVPFIANALARINRYAGHWRHPISVARHSIVVAHALASKGYFEAIQLQGLFHDASEAYTTDIPSPLKHVLRVYTDVEVVDYATFEDRLLESIYRKLGIGGKYPIHEAVWEEDRVQYQKETPFLRDGKNPVYYCGGVKQTVREFITRAKYLMKACGVPYRG